MFEISKKQHLDNSYMKNWTDNFCRNDVHNSNIKLYNGIQQSYDEILRF